LIYTYIYIMILSQKGFYGGKNNELALRGIKNIYNAGYNWILSEVSGLVMCCNISGVVLKKVLNMGTSKLGGNNDIIIIIIIIIINYMYVICTM